MFTGDYMIGIIVAEEKELNAVKNIMKDIEEINMYEKYSSCKK